MSNDEGFWCPNLIDNIVAFLRRGIPNDNILDHSPSFVRNIGYNLQYLEFLNETLLNTPLHSTVRKQTKKTFIITGMSIIEAILWYVLKKNNQHNMVEWKEVRTLKTNQYSENGVKHKCEVTTYIKIDPPEPKPMTLDTMVKKVESKKLLGLNSQIYKDLNYLRKLRNRVHIHSVQNSQDTDWYIFNENEVNLMRNALYSVFTSSMFNPEPKHEKFISYLKK